MMMMIIGKYYQIIENNFDWHSFRIIQDQDHRGNCAYIALACINEIKRDTAVAETLQGHAGNQHLRLLILTTGAGNDTKTEA